MDQSEGKLSERRRVRLQALMAIMEQILRAGLAEVNTACSLFGPHANEAARSGHIQQWQCRWSLRSAAELPAEVTTELTRDFEQHEKAIQSPLRSPPPSAASQTHLPDPHLHPAPPPEHPSLPTLSRHEGGGRHDGFWKTEERLLARGAAAYEELIPGIAHGVGPADSRARRIVECTGPR